MYNAVLLSAALLTGQVEAPPHTVHILPPIGAYVEPAPVRHGGSGKVVGGIHHSDTVHTVGDVRLVSGGSCSSGNCGGPCTTGRCTSERCNVQWLRPWTCKDLEMTPVEPAKQHCCGGLLYRLLYCPEAAEEENGNGNGNGKEVNGEKNGKNGEKNGKNGETNGKNGEKNGEAKNGENGDKKDEDEAEETPEPTPLMQWIRCRAPSLFERMECNGVKAYGFVQGGYTFNVDSPRDRLNYGVNFNNRSNDFLLNQLYFILEKPLDLAKRKDEWHFGFRVDMMYGHDAPYFENAGLGFLDNQLGDRGEYSRLSEMGFGMWQFYADLHAPILTKRGVDFRVGRFISLMGHESSLGNGTNFYSRPYEFFYGVPFTNTGALATVHLGDTVDFTNGLVRGYEVVFQDNNDSWSYTGSLVWNSCDQRKMVSLAWITGPEQTQNNDNNRTLVHLFGHRKFGCYNQYKVMAGGTVGWEQNAAINALGLTQAGEWYGLHTSAFYTVDPRLTLGMRAEWWRDDDGVRTAQANSDFGGARWNRPGYAGNFYEVTLGATYRAYQNLRLRPEVRFDWFDGIAVDGSASRPYNDRTDRFQTTIGLDVIWDF